LLPSGVGGSVPLSLNSGDNWIPVQVTGGSGGSTTRFYFGLVSRICGYGVVWVGVQGCDRGRLPKL
jgi:hypothetical protein